MLVATMNGRRLQAAKASKGQGLFQCPNCLEGVVLRQGLVRVPHFAHRAVATCDWSVGESAIHLQAKQVLVDALQKSGYYAEPEVPIGAQRADVYAERDGDRFVLELQHTPIDPRELERRTRGYVEANVHVAWVSLADINYNCFLQPTDMPIPMRYSPRPFERWLEVYGSGRLLLFNPTLGNILKAKLRAHKTTVPLNEWTPRGGVPQAAGGYQKTSKQYADLFCEELMPLERLELECGWRNSELRVSGMGFPRGGFARLVLRP